MGTETLTRLHCYHCGLLCPDDSIVSTDKVFCCTGCLAVYQLLVSTKLDSYYKENESVGRRPNSNPTDRFAYLDSPEIYAKAFEYLDTRSAKVRLHIPQIHCASCIWLLENLHLLDAGIVSSRAKLTTRELTVEFDHTHTSLRKVVELLAKLGYEPDVSLDGVSKPKRRNPNWQLYAKLGVAGFALSNIMLFSLPEYLAAHGINDSYLSLTFRYASLLLALPVLIYSAGDYFRSAYLGIKQRTMNLDVPLALGIGMLFARSAYDILLGTGPGYLDSFTGLVFVLLIGKLFQRYTFERLSFDRDYRSYFPISCLKREGEKEQVVHISALRSGDHVVVRNKEIIPADSFLISGRACIDYSFVTGESTPQEVEVGRRLFAGGRQVGGAIELEVVNEVSDSYLISLWENGRSNSLRTQPSLQRLADRVAGPFIAIVLLIAAVTAWFWWQHDPTKLVHSVTSVLLVACPCALALAGPFVLGTVARIWGEKGFFVRSPEVVEELSQIDEIVFDKTGTLTVPNIFEVDSSRLALFDKQKDMVSSLARHSTHPLSRAIVRSLSSTANYPVSHFEETPGRGIQGIVAERTIRIGTAEWCGLTLANMTQRPHHTAGTVFVTVDGVFVGSLEPTHLFRNSIPDLFARLKQRFSISVLSGDLREQEASVRSVLGSELAMQFACTPHDKREYVTNLVKNGKRTVMIGDGLNDSGAIKAASVGISVTDDMSAFTPACDGILDADKLSLLDRFLRMAKQSRHVIVAAYALALVYNVVGLAYAVTGNLSPLVSAILMPISSITIVLFSTLITRRVAQREGLLS